MKNFLIGTVLGIVAVFFVKYIVVGLYYWDSRLHPERLAADSTGPWKQFFPPMLGVFGTPEGAKAPKAPAPDATS